MNAQIELADERSKFAAMPTEQLKQEFVGGLRITRDHLLRLAAILAELESRGEKVDGDSHLLKMLRAIGAGTLLVDVVVRFAGRPYTLASIKRLPIEKQAELLECDDNEVDETFRSRPRPSSHREGTGQPQRNRLHAAEAGECVRPMPKFAAMGAAGTVKDVAEMCLEAIRSSCDPQAVAAELLPEVQRIKNSQRSRTA